MGSCVGRSSREPSTTSDTNDPLGGSNAVTIGKNKPLTGERPKWKSQTPMTTAQLKNKRDEFWDTAPSYEGRREIWDALKAACDTPDYSLAQAIVDGASISLPTGSLTDAYDELGNHYVIPVYCISNPVNLVENDSGESSAVDDGSLNGKPKGEETIIKIRLSTSQKDIKWTVYTSDTILALKRRVKTELNVDPSKQRWFYSGKILVDRMTIADSNIPKGFVIQVIITPDHK